MSAGLDWNETLPYTDPKNDNTAMNTSDDWIGYVLDRGQSEPSGERFAYTSGLSILLGGVVQQATSDYPDQFAEKVLFNHLGISDYQWSAAPDGTRHTGGGLSLRPRDFAKIGQLVLNRGVWQGKQVVSEQWIEASTSRQTGEEDTPYGYQWWLTSFETEAGPIQAISAQGYGGQFLFVIPELELVVAFTAGDFEGDGARPKERMEKFILPAVLGKAD